MIAILVSLLACDAGPADSDPVDSADTGTTPSACDCEVRDDLPFTVTEDGGFDDWGGAAMGWAVDGVQGRVLVVGMRYTLGVSVIPLTLGCDDPDALAASWVPGVPTSAADAAARYPLLAAALTTAPGVHSLADEVGALLLEGNLEAGTIDRAWVSTGGSVSLRRGEGSDQLQGAVEFAARVTEVGEGAQVACDSAVRVAAFSLDWPSSGDE